MVAPAPQVLGWRKRLAGHCCTSIPGRVQGSAPLSWRSRRAGLGSYSRGLKNSSRILGYVVVEGDTTNSLFGPPYCSRVCRECGVAQNRSSQIPNPKTRNPKIFAIWVVVQIMVLLWVPYILGAALYYRPKNPGPMRPTPHAILREVGNPYTEP